MGTVTIGRVYFDALLRRAQFHTSGREFELAPDLLSNVIVSKAEYDHLPQALLKSALFRGGLTMDTLNTLLVSENEASNGDVAQYEDDSTQTFPKAEATPVTTQKSHIHDSSPISDDDTDAGSDRLGLPQPRPLPRTLSSGQTEAGVDGFSDEEQDYRLHRGHRDHTPVHEQRTVLISNLAKHTTHKDIAGVVRGGRLIEIFLRNDRSATVSFVEGAVDFLAYAKRNDIYLHAKRLDFRWANRQFQVAPHMSKKIAAGVSRNLIVRGVAGKVTEQQIRDQLDHIHNLVVVDVYFQKGDAHISTNSIHNAVYAKTCMMSRTIYKGTRIDWALDECAGPLPKPNIKVRSPVTRTPSAPISMTNTYALLDTSSEVDSDSHAQTCLPNDLRLEHSGWTNAVVSFSTAWAVKEARLKLQDGTYDQSRSDPAVPQNPEHNFNKAANFVRSAAAQGAELAVLPEYHLTSWVPKDPSFAGLCDEWETYLKKYQELAKECGICIVPGTIVEGHRGEQRKEDRLLNVAYFIGKEGEILGKYVKKNLWYVNSSSLSVHRLSRLWHHAI
ncbi:hypothetical protein OPT61_g6487 [Boeremia exigua]|uniref:Uncharacterized protein n=1 Tax=Boeremia exigua TaxID=749465 RepID=A0ACC2I6G6_9PLEO|nr:hypothetical protein OPT61_g6487 [Boeremia exigua]